MMNDISARLLAAIKASKSSYGDLAKQTGIPKSAINRYATGLTEKIPIDRLQLLADALGTTTEHFLGWEEAQENDAACQLAQEMVEHRNILSIYDALNRAGREALCDYGSFLGTKDEYKADESAPVYYGPPIPHFLTAAAAGYAAPIEGEDYEMVERTAETPHGADYCIEIDGDSMEPYIHDGQRVYVKRDATDMREFEVGIFYVDGDVLCKQWCRDYAGTLHLLSANPKRQDANRQIRKNSGQHVVCFGKVLLGKKLPHPNYY